MKVGVISDTHLKGYDERLKRIIERHFCDTELVLHAGDLVDMCVLDMFGAKEVRAVWGNMDPPSVRKVLPKSITLQLGPFRVGLIHGCGAPAEVEDSILNTFDSPDCIVYGHTHAPANRMKEGVLLFNPGSAVDRRFSPHSSLGILKISHVIEAEIITL